VNHTPTATARAGLAVFGVLSIGDIVTLALTDGDHPPYAVAILSAVLGLASLPLVVRAWRDVRRQVRALVVMRVISAATCLPAFFISDVPDVARLSAGAIVALTALAVVLIATGAQSTSALAEVGLSVGKPSS
jgi:hypothetical protein